MTRQTVETKARGLAGWSRRGKVLLPLLVGAFCVEVAMAVQQIAYEANPCKINEAGKFASIDGGCKDLKTGRVWSRNTISAERGASFWSYSGAKIYCGNLVEGGMEDWRLPTRDEMKTVAANSAGTHLDVFWVHGNNNGGVPYEFDFSKWSSTTIKGGRYAYVVQLGSGTAQADGWATNGSSWADVVCVR